MVAMTSKLRSAKRTTRANASKHTVFVQLPYYIQRRRLTKFQISNQIPDGDAKIPVFIPDDDETIQSNIPNGDETIQSQIPDDDETISSSYVCTPIDFGDAHDEWMSNKKRLANGQYVYLCGKITGTGNKCKRGCHDLIGLYSGCKIHFMWEENLNF
jgi:hypothetical protein